MKVESQWRILDLRFAVRRERWQIDVAPRGIVRHLMQKKVDLILRGSAAAESVLENVRCLRRDSHRAAEERAQAAVHPAKVVLQHSRHTGDGQRVAHPVLPSRRLRYSPRSRDLRGRVAAGRGASCGTAVTSMRPI